MELNEYEQLFLKRRTAPQSVTNLCGRIIRGKEPSDFTGLTDDPDRKLVMLMGPDGLDLLLGKSGYEMLVAIGYEPDYLKHKVREGNQFKLVVFPEGGPAKPATWDNVIEIVSIVYEEAADALNQHREALKSRTFASIQDEAGFSFLDVEKTGESDPRFMTYERFCQSPRSLVATRAFLYFTVHLRELFSGDGYTYDDQGRRGMMEYIVPNKQLNELGSYRLIDLEVALPPDVRREHGGEKCLNK